jgi:hypothetical protein
MDTERGTAKNVLKLHRWISVLVFVTLFFLPLHFHAASALTSEITKDCSCLHGTRTQLGLVAVAIQSAPALHFDFEPSIESQCFSQIVADLSSIRAPPAL